LILEWNEKVRREPRAVASHRLQKSAGLDTVERREIRIDENTVPANRHDPLGDSGG
jgi:hypothetical protein